MDIENIIYIAIFILFSIFSGKKKADKKKRQKEEEEADAPDTSPSLEDEIRRMTERLTGKVEAKKEQEATTPTQPEYKRPQYATPYETDENKINYDRDEEPIERIPTQPITNYGNDDIERLREHNKRLRTKKYEEKEVTNYEYRSIDSLAKGKELHSVMDDDKETTTVVETLDEYIDFSDFDAREAVVYAEILKRPQY